MARALGWLRRRAQREQKQQARRYAVALALLSCAGIARGEFWSSSSTRPVEPLGHPTPQQRARTLQLSEDDGFRFVAYGDQRALADGEWQAMVGHIARLAAASEEPPLLFLLDTGDIVLDGRKSDQFHQLRELLAPVRELPYLVALGNHELSNERDPIARSHTAVALAGSVHEGFPADPEQMHWEWSRGPLRVLALDSNRLVYERPDEDEAAHQQRAQAELRWLAERLREPEGSRHTIVALHHPFLQTSSKHREDAIELWQMEFEGRRLADLLADGGVDLVLTGHTHTYELFLMTRDDGHAMWMMNLSGRPRGAWMGLGAWLRRAKDIRGEEAEWLDDKGFNPRDGWSIEQVEVMRGTERDQYAVFDVGSDGALSVQLYFFGKKEPYELESGGQRRLLPALP